MPEEDNEGHRQGFCYPYDQDALGVGGPLDRMLFNDFQMGFITAVNVRPKLATTYAHRSVCQARFAGAPPEREPEHAELCLRALKLWCILPALLHSQDGRTIRTARFKSSERRDLATILPWLMECTEDTAARLQGPARGATEAAKCEGTPSACRHQRRISLAARDRLVEPRVLGNETTMTIVQVKFPVKTEIPSRKQWCKLG